MDEGNGVGKRGMYILYLVCTNVTMCLSQDCCCYYGQKQATVSTGSVAISTSSGSNECVCFRIDINYNGKLKKVVFFR